MTTTSDAKITPGSGTNVATYDITEDAETKKLQRVTVNDSSGAEINPAVTTVNSSALESSHVLKSSAGKLFSFEVCATSVAGWVLLFDATSAPADGSVTPKKAWQVAAGATLGVESRLGISCSTGIVLVFSTTGPFTKAASATAFFSGEIA